jgi:hypothetical protein
MRAKTDTRAYSPFHLTLKIWDAYAGQPDEESGYEQWLEGFLKRLVPPKLNTDETRVRLSLAAALQLNEGFITPSTLETLVVNHMLNAAGGPTPQPAALAGPGSQASVEEPADLDEVFAAKGVEDENVEMLFAPATQKSTETPAAATDQPASAPPARKEAPKLGGEIGKLLQHMVSAGALVAYPRGRYQFRHAHVADYLASLTLQTATEEQLAEKAFDPAWQDALGYAGLKRPIDAAVNARLSAPSDLIYDNLLAVSRWMPYAGDTAEWRTQALRQLGNVLVAPSQYTLVRERAAAALITTRDKGALKIFRVAARNSNRDVRRLACLGMGALGDPDVIPELAERMGDEVIDVQLAAGMALGAIGTAEALEAMVDGLTSGTERWRDAEASAIPDDGYPLLYDATL